MPGHSYKDQPVFSGVPKPGDRLLIIDLARTAALGGMVTFHAARDLEIFGLIPPGTTLSGGWALFARIVAGTFIFLSGFSFVLAHRRGLRVTAWARRTTTIVVAAVLVTIATVFAFPDKFIYFGILHAIGFFLLLGPLLLPLSTPALAVLATGAVAVVWQFGRSGFDAAWLAWTGLSSGVRPSLDFVPVFPWITVFILGMAVARIVASRLLGRSLDSHIWSAIAFPGRYSLTVYLVHQPILLALIWMLTMLR